MRKKINLFVFDENNSSKQNGIGTFMSLLIPELGAIRGLNLTLVSLNSDYRQLTSLKHKNYREIAFPWVNGGNWRNAAMEIVSSLRFLIEDDPHNIFMINHSPCSGLIFALQTVFPESKTIFIIHDQGWCPSLMGNAELFHSVIHNERSIIGKVPESIINKVKDYFRKEVEIYTEVDAVVCLSPSTRKILELTYQVDPVKINLIPNCYTSNRRNSLKREVARKELGIGEKERILLFAGRPALYKGVAVLIKSIKELSSIYPDLRCVFCGSMAGFSDYETLINEVAPRLVFTGHVSRDKMSLWYSAADVGVVPSYTEQFGYSAFEMVDYGLPLVTSDGSGLRDYFHDGINAFIAKIGDYNNIDEYVKNLVSAVSEALSCDTDMKKRLRLFNEKLIQEKFSPPLIAKKYSDVISEICFPCKH